MKTGEELIAELVSKLSSVIADVGINVTLHVEPGDAWGLDDGTVVLVDDVIAFWSTSAHAGYIVVDDLIDASDPSVGIFGAVEPKSWSNTAHAAVWYDCSAGVSRDVVTAVTMRILTHMVDRSIDAAERAAFDVEEAYQ